MSIKKVLDNLRAAYTNERDKGTAFERLIAKYLMTDPKYANKLEKVWLWGD